MPRLNIDLTDAQSNKPIDVGVYEFELESVSEAKAGAKSQYVTFIWNCVEEPFVGRKIYDNRPITGKGAGLFADAYSKLTGEDIDVDDLAELDVDTDDLLGNRVLITVEHEEYQGETQHRVKKLSAL
jgi:hypothetical protein